MLNRYDRCFLDLIVSHDSILDLYTRYPLPATLDEVVKLVDYISVIVISDVCDIARLEPAIITDQLSGLLGCVKVLRRYPRAFHPDLSEGFAVLWNLFVGLIIDYLHLDTWNWKSCMGTDFGPRFPSVSALWGASLIRELLVLSPSPHIQLPSRYRTFHGTR